MNDAINPSLDIPMKQYALYLKDLQMIGTRHEHARKYYLTLISVLFTILSLGGTTGLAFRVTPGLVWLVALFGAMICVLWRLHMRSFKTLFKVKFQVLAAMEVALPEHPFTQESADLFKPETNYRSILKTDMAVACIFIALFILLPFMAWILPAK